MARIYDKYREIDIEVGAAQAEAMAKWKPNRYVLPSEVEDEEPIKDGSKETVEQMNDRVSSAIDVAKDNFKIDKSEIDNSEVDATRGAVKLADENGINLNDIYEGERINKQTVQNYIDGQN